MSKDKGSLEILTECIDEMKASNEILNKNLQNLKEMKSCSLEMTRQSKSISKTIDGININDSIQTLKKINDTFSELENDNKLLAIKSMFSEFKPKLSKIIKLQDKSVKSIDNYYQKFTQFDSKISRLSDYNRKSSELLKQFKLSKDDLLEICSQVDSAHNNLKNIIDRMNKTTLTETGKNKLKTINKKISNVDRKTKEVSNETQKMLEKLEKTNEAFKIIHERLSDLNRINPNIQRNVKEIFDMTESVTVKVEKIYKFYFRPVRRIIRTFVFLLIILIVANLGLLLLNISYRF